MPDQLFEHFHLDTTPPPVEAVRRRGERRRRRTAAAVAAASVAAVVAVATPVTLLAGGTDRGEPQPSHTGSVAPTPTGGWVTTIPRSFDLTPGMPQTPAPTLLRITDPLALVQYSTVLPIDLGGCDAPLWEYAGAKATLLAQWTDHTEAVEMRSLSTYEDATAARAAFDRIREGVVSGCPGGPLSPVPVALQGAQALPGQAVAWVQPKATGGRPDGTGTAFVVVQVGNVLLIDRAAMSGAGDARARRLTVKHLANRGAVVVSAATEAFPSPSR